MSSGSRPFQFHACQFLPGASTDITCTFRQHEQPEINKIEVNNPEIEKQNKNDIQQSQLGELRHTRDRLKLNLPFNKTNESSNSQAIIHGSDESDADNLTINNSAPELSTTCDDFNESIELSCQDDEENPKNDTISDDENKNDFDTKNQPKSSGRPLVISDDKNKNNNVTFIVENDNEVTENNEILTYDNGKIKPSDESTKKINGNILQ